MRFLFHGKSVLAIACAIAAGPGTSYASIPFECSTDEMSYALADDLSDHVSVYLVAYDQRVLLANCAGNEMINIKQIGEPTLQHHIGYALGEIERMSASDVAFTFDDVATRLRGLDFTADIVPLRRDDCVCGEK